MNISAQEILLLDRKQANFGMKKNPAQITQPQEVQSSNVMEALDIQGRNNIAFQGVTARPLVKMAITLPLLMGGLTCLAKNNTTELNSPIASFSYYSNDADIESTAWYEDFADLESQTDSLTTVGEPRFVLTKKEHKIIKNLVFNSFSEEVRKNGLSSVVDTISVDYSNPIFADEVARVKKWVDMVQGYNIQSKYDVEAIMSTIERKNKLEKEDKRIIKVIVAAKKQEVINKELQVIESIFQQLRGDKTLAELNFYEIGEGIIQELGKRGLVTLKEKVVYTDEYGDIDESMPQQMFTPFKSKDTYYEEAFDQFVGLMRVMARNVKNSTLPDIKGTTASQITSTVISEHADVAGEDPLYDEVANQDPIPATIASRRYNFNTRREELSHIYFSKIREYLGSSALIKLMTGPNQGFLNQHRNPDGTYDLTSISDAVLYRTGYNWQLDLTNDDEISEMRNTIRELKYLTGQDFTETEVKRDILKLVNMPCQHRDHSLFPNGAGPVLQDALTGVASGMVGIQFLEMTQTQNFNLTSMFRALAGSGDVAANLTEQAALLLSGKEGVVRNALTGDLVLTQTQHLAANLLPLSAAGGAFASAAAGILIRAAIGTIPDERACRAITDFDFTNDRYTDAAKYERYLRTILPDQKASMLVEMFKIVAQDENGNYDPAKWVSVGNIVAGLGSLPNHEECIGAQIFYKPAWTKTPESDPDPDPVDEGAMRTEGWESVFRAVDVPEINAYHSGWRHMVTGYECLSTWYQEPVRILKLVQAIKPNEEGLCDYSKERLDRLYDLSMKAEKEKHNVNGVSTKALMNEPNFDFDVYKNAYEATYFAPTSVVKLPDNIAGCQRTKTLEELSVAPAASTRSTRQSYSSSTGSAQQNIRENQYYAAFKVKGEGQKWLKFTGSDWEAQRNAAVNAYLAEHPNVKRSDIEFLAPSAELLAKINADQQ